MAPQTRDNEFSWEDFFERNNPVLGANEGNELVATWGNLASRMLSFAYKRFDGCVPEPGELDEADQALQARVEGGFKAVGELYGACKFRAALGEALALAREANGYTFATLPSAPLPSSTRDRRDRQCKPGPEGALVPDQG